MILDNLRKAGVQNTVRDERLKFDRLDHIPRRVAPGRGRVHRQDRAGPEGRRRDRPGARHGRAGDGQGSRQGGACAEAGFDLLIVCGFAFDAHADETADEFRPEPNGSADGRFVAEEARQYGKLQTLLVRTNPDLAMGEALLKTTGAGNLFMVFGEPDLEIRPASGYPQDDGKLVVEVRGVDVYDPTTGAIRSNSTDDIACWFIDTDYNEESFFVRHAYFTGADEPYDPA